MGKAQLADNCFVKERNWLIISRSDGFPAPNAFVAAQAVSP